ncbi:MAG: REP-associated tyrosine transposase [Casimicrobium sp.]
MKFRSNELRRGRTSVCGQTYHVTVTTRERIRVFEDFWKARAVMTSFRQSDRANLTRTIAIVVMADHFHWLFELHSDTLSRAVARVKASVTRQLKHDESIWQSGFHDHAIRRDESITQIGNYIIHNPVRAGLVQEIVEYPHWHTDWI